MSSASTSWRVIVIEDDGAEALQQCLSQLAGTRCRPPKTIVQFGGAGKEAGAGGQGAQDEGDLTPGSSHGAHDAKIATPR